MQRKGGTYSSKEIEDTWFLAQQFGASTKDVSGVLAGLRRSKRIQLMDGLDP